MQTITSYICICKHYSLYIYSALYTTKLTCQIRFFDPKKPLPVKRTAKKLGSRAPVKLATKEEKTKRAKSKTPMAKLRSMVLVGCTPRIVGIRMSRPSMGPIGGPKV